MPPIEVQPAFDRVRKLTPPEQQAWLRRLEDRASRAARLTLKAEEATGQQAQIRAKLHQKTITWQVLRKVVEDTDKREKDAIDAVGEALSKAGF